MFLTAMCAAAAVWCLCVSRESQENGISQRVHDHLHPVGCQHVQWPISRVENC